MEQSGENFVCKRLDFTFLIPRKGVDVIPSWACLYDNVIIICYFNIIWKSNMKSNMNFNIGEI